MIVFKELRWSNAFSYGPDNRLVLDASPLTQLVGKNGHGKSSIALILEEALYNKNSKGLKKGDILNRYTDAKAYTIGLDFSVDEDEYTIETRRGATQTVKLLKNGEDVSCHTSTQTYKLIEQLIGKDHKAFTQIVYLSHAGSLEFLTAPDTARKKFLIELLNLGVYGRAGDLFKQLTSDLSKEVAAATAKVTTVSEWLKTYRNADTSTKPTQNLPDEPYDLVEKVSSLKHTLADIEVTNSKISTNLQIRDKLSKVTPPEVPKLPEADNSAYISAKATNEKSLSDALAFKRKMAALGTLCPTCYQPVDTERTDKLIAEQDAIIAEATEAVADYTARINEFNKASAAHKAAKAALDSYTKLAAQYNSELESALLDSVELQNEINELNSEIRNVQNEISRIRQSNKIAETHNAKIDGILSQIESFEKELTENQAKLSVLVDKHSVLQTLVKAFSTTGLVAYKIENSVKDLEELTNEYLGELSSGRFSLSFQISGSDKLNVVINDNGNDIDINALSGGERARVNVAALLAIRKLMQTLSKDKLNLLILDETIENLDAEGKEKLIEVLLSEKALNTILVSHGFSHPLLEKTFVTKTNNISRIES